jgi:hypothetical protein
MAFSQDKRTWNDAAGHIESNSMLFILTESHFGQEIESCQILTTILHSNGKNRQTSELNSTKIYPSTRSAESAVISKNFP